MGEETFRILTVGISMFAVLATALLLILRFTGTRITKEDAKRDIAIAELATAMTALAGTVTGLDKRMARAEGNLHDVEVEVRTRRSNGDWGV